MENPNSDMTFIEWVIGGVTAVGAFIATHIYMRITQVESRSFSELAVRDKKMKEDRDTTAKAQDSIWQEVQRQAEVSDKFREKILSTMVTRDDMKADLRDLKNDLLEALRRQS